MNISEAQAAALKEMFDAAGALLNNYDRYESPEIARLWDAVNRVGSVPAVSA